MGEKKRKRGSKGERKKRRREGREGGKEKKKGGGEKLVPTNKNKTSISLLNCHFNYKLWSFQGHIQRLLGFTTCLDNDTRTQEINCLCIWLLVELTLHPLALQKFQLWKDSPGKADPFSALGFLAHKAVFRQGDPNLKREDRVGATLPFVTSESSLKLGGLGWKKWHPKENLRAIKCHSFLEAWDGRLWPSLLATHP